MEPSLASVFSIFSVSSISSISPVSPTFSAIPNVPIMHNNPVVPVIHTGSVVGASTDAIGVIFEYWKTTMNYPYSKLDCNRSSLIRKALKMGYSVQQLCDAITGCSLTPHNIGENEQKQRYDGLHIILRDADQIDRFIRNYHHPPQKENKAQKRLKENLHVTKEWAATKLNKLA